MIKKNQISVLLANKLQSLIKEISPLITDITIQTGIENIGQSNVQIPDSRPSEDVISNVTNTRNKIVLPLNASSKSIEALTKLLTPLNTFVNTISKSLETISIARKAANIGIAFIPSPPGVPGSAVFLINLLRDLEETLPPKLNLSKNKADSISITLDYINRILFNITNIVNTIDTYLIKYGVSKDDLTSMNDYLKNVEKTYNEVKISDTSNQIYKGFMLEIVEEPYSPTVNRRKAVAKNNNGIILLQTPLSFTTASQILIEELKLIIDSSDLKAY